MLYLSDNRLAALQAEISKPDQAAKAYPLPKPTRRAPPEIASLPSLLWLYLDNNQLAALPPEIASLTKLQILNLSGNQLAALHPEIGSLTSLQALDLTNNRLTTLPPELARLTSLDSLDLSYNQLTPEIEAAYSAGLDELRAYLRSLSADSEVIREAKLVLVGEGNLERHASSPPCAGRSRNRRPLYRN